ncbi:bile acid:sodium symporter family protein [Mammaliicoccus stepanovicii]|uniref:Sodium-dependent transporter n=1 Tax=Mammaliicoccus stepanovicii TaxID=643214 RepID=A0A239YQK8_9STAP|nr:bile acid:sodium symporter family protein [Mammaliicoccus stepanovicii]PNZ73220.1 symporter [Mammaliicoccus stepanovicii]GGI42395.1 sodium transporter [Mammaliicoccus stepanovicii]SNV61491.1 sodium-dependent transporter [Mammaliicoccus stepanovicii]
MRAIQKFSQFINKTFVIWMLIAAILGFSFPSIISQVAPYIPYLLGIVMFGMGMTISTKDFKEVFKSPKSVLIGVILQYTVMPVTAYLIAKGFHLSPDVALGVILVGCCPGGTASNVISYLAKANTALSVSVTTVSTLLAPIVTPSLIFLFAREWLQVSFSSMFISVIQVVLIPIILGIIVQKFFRPIADKSVDILPIISVIAISLILSSVVAGNKTQIIATGLLLFGVVLLHNVSGLTIGYLLAKLFKLDRPDKRAISIEVGMQNSGLAVSLATAHFNPLSAVPGAIFSFVHLLTGPLIAIFWSNQTKRMNKAK